MKNDLHSLDAAIALEGTDGDSFLAQTSPAYAGMIGPYGGITAAQAVQALIQHPARVGEPIALTLNFAAALEDGQFTIVVRPVRTNRSTQHWSIDIRQGAQSVLAGVAVTALRRETWSAVEQRPPEVPRPSEVEREEPQRVTFMDRYELKFIEGSLRIGDGREQSHSRSCCWMRDNPPRALDFPSLTAMADLFLPRIWIRRAKFVPIATVSLSVYFHVGASDLNKVGMHYVLGRASGQSFRNGYFDHAGCLWNEGGDLLATTNQLVYFKE